MPRLWKALCLAMATTALALFAISCGSGGTSYRVINAIANYNYQSTGGMDIAMNGSLVFSGVQFTNVNPPGKDKYQSVASGSDALDVYAHGDDINGGTPFIQSALSFSGRTQYTVMLMGNNLNNPYVAQPFTDDNSVPASGNFEFRVIDASSNMPSTVDIYIVGSVAIVTGPNPPQPNASLTFGQASPYVALPAGTWWLVVTTHGGHFPIINPNSYTPTALQISTIVLIDGVNGFGIGSPFEYSDLN